jgi:tyrosyl-tRNA synthetase
MHKSGLMRTFTERGYMYQCTNVAELDALAEKQIIPGYIGFDCTAKSLHVGSLVQIMMLRILQKMGHKPIVIMGGATTRIGDPTGRDQARQLLTDADINSNKESLKQVFAKFLKFGDGPTDAIMIDNAEWLNGIKYIDFLRDIGRHFTINRMLTFDSVKLRLEREQPLSFLEFNYMLLQAYDFVELNRRYGCLFQMGGSDQWGNIVNGVELGRKVENVELFGLTSELITSKSGAKMGKTASGAVWLNEEMLPAYDYWQFWRNVDDQDVGRFLRLFTELDLTEIARLEKLQGKELNEAKVVLANCATTLCHGAEAAATAHATAIKTFTEGGIGSDLPIFTVTRSEIAEGVPAHKMLHMAGLCASLGEAKRLIQGKGARINNMVIESEHTIIGQQHLQDGVIKLSAGQKKHVILKPC